MNAEIQYLKEIADSLKKLGNAGITGSSAVSATGTISIGGAGFKAIADKIADGLIATIEEQEEGQAVSREVSVIDIVRDALLEVLHQANFITVQEQQGGQTVQVEKSIFEVIKDDIAAL